MIGNRKIMKGQIFLTMGSFKWHLQMKSRSSFLSQPKIHEVLKGLNLLMNFNRNWGLMLSYDYSWGKIRLHRILKTKILHLCRFSQMIIWLTKWNQLDPVYHSYQWFFTVITIYGHEFKGCTGFRKINENLQ